jgi:hypothetical protein
LLITEALGGGKKFATPVKGASKRKEAAPPAPAAKKKVKRETGESPPKKRGRAPKPRRTAKSEEEEDKPNVDSEASKTHSHMSSHFSPIVKCLGGLYIHSCVRVEWSLYN